MIDWLALCRAAADDVERAVAQLHGRAARERGQGVGAGGDETTAIDAAAEAAVLARLEELDAAGVAYSLVSEEAGERARGGPPSWWVVVDPIDGSINAKRGLPFHSLSIAVADGPTLGDVAVAFVRDLSTGQEFAAERGKGATLDGRPLVDRPKVPIELLALEATTTALIAEAAPRLVAEAQRLRVMGSLALALCHVAAGQLDAVASLRPVRSVDVAAGQLLVREQGLALVLPDGGSLDAAPLDLTHRSRIVAAATPEACAALAAALDRPG